MRSEGRRKELMTKMKVGNRFYRSICFYIHGPFIISISLNFAPNTIDFVLNRKHDLLSLHNLYVFPLFVNRKQICIFKCFHHLDVFSVSVHKPIDNCALYKFIFYIFLTPFQLWRRISDKETSETGFSNPSILWPQKPAIRNMEKSCVTKGASEPGGNVSLWSFNR